MYELLAGERTDDKFDDAYCSPHNVLDIPVGLAERDAVHARMDANPERLARARRTKEGYEWLFHASESTA